MSRLLGRVSGDGAGNPLPRAWRGIPAEQDEQGAARAEAARILFDARVRARAFVAEARAEAETAIAAETRQARERDAL